MRVLVIGLLLGAQAFGQVILDAAHIPAAEDVLQRNKKGDDLRCTVRGFKPFLDFSFRFQTGYSFSIPLDQFSGSGHAWVVIAKVTPESGDGKPVYLFSTTRLPEIPGKTKASAESGGGFLVGAGAYRVEWALVDRRGRSCHKQWRVEAELRRSERNAKLRIADHAVATFSYRTLPIKPSGEADVRRLRITVLLHAAPLYTRLTRLPAQDRIMLLGSLSSLVSQLPIQSVRLVVFNLDKQSELFRQDDLDQPGFERVISTLNSLELGVVDYNVLKNRRGRVDLLADLVNEELTAESPADAVIFLGPTARYYDKFSESLLESAGNNAPAFFYLQYKPYWGRSAPWADSIQLAVKKLKGKTMLIYSPGEFAKAIEQIGKASGNN